MLGTGHRRYEVALVSTMGAAVCFAMLGAIIVNLGSTTLFRIGQTLLTVAILATLVSVGLSAQIDRLHQIGAKRSGGDTYDQMRNWTRLKVSSIFLQVLMLLATILLTAALFSRVGIVDTGAPYRGVVLAASIVIMTLVLAVHGAQWFSLRTQLKKDNPGLDNTFLMLSLTGGGILTLLAIVVTFVPLSIPGFAVIKHTDAPFLLLAAAVLAGGGLFIARSLPTLYALFYEERDYYHGKTYLSKSKSVVMPAMIAFSLLFLVVLIIFVFQLGVAGIIGNVHRSSLMMGLFGFIVIALVVSTIVSVLLSRSEDKTAIYRVKRSAEQVRAILILSISGGLTAILMAIAAALYAGIEFAGLKSAWWLDFFTFGVLTAVGPYGFYIASKATRIRNLEERFPDFLRDIAASHKAGLPLASAVRIAANGEYGALTPEIRKMADQLTWNVAFTEVLDRFAVRVDTPLVQRSVSLMTEASKSGGNIVDVLMAAARDAREIKNLESERSGAMMLYTAVIYLTFIVFLGVAVMLYKTFITEILTAAQQTVAAGGGMGGLSFSALTLDDYRIFYFVAALMQGLGNGIMAGLMSTGKVLLGLRHSFVMVTLTYFVFKLLA